MSVRNDILAYAKEQFTTEADYPFPDDYITAVLRHKDNRRWYAIIMKVNRANLGLSGEGTADIMNVKGDPLLLDLMRMNDGFLPAYHMNKEKWISILLDGTAPFDDICRLLNMSYKLTESRKREKPDNITLDK